MNAIDATAHPRVASSRSIIEVACDESGSEGDKLVGGTTAVFAHASVNVSAEAATECIQQLRLSIRSPATEYKAGHLLREKHRPILRWILGDTGPIHGNARVYLVDKEFFLLGKLVDLFIEGGDHAASIGLSLDPRTKAHARTFYRDGPRSFGPERWQAFAVSFNDLMRTRNRWGEVVTVDSFFDLVTAMRLTAAPGPIADVLALLSQALPQAESMRTRLLSDPRMLPTHDPLIPAIVQVIAYWGDETQAVSIVHDEQTTLTAGRIAQLRELLSAPQRTLLRNPPRGRLVSLRTVDSMADPRVQIADFVAGITRRIAEDELNGRGDTEIAELLEPYVDPASIWADDRYRQTASRIAATSSARRSNE